MMAIITTTNGIGSALLAGAGTVLVSMMLSQEFTNHTRPWTTLSILFTLTLWPDLSGTVYRNLTFSGLRGIELLRFTILLGKVSFLVLEWRSVLRHNDLQTRIMWAARISFYFWRGEFLNWVECGLMMGFKPIRTVDELPELPDYCTSQPVCAAFSRIWAQCKFN